MTSLLSGCLSTWLSVALCEVGRGEDWPNQALNARSVWKVIYQQVTGMFNTRSSTGCGGFSALSLMSHTHCSALNAETLPPEKLTLVTRKLGKRIATFSFDGWVHVVHMLLSSLPIRRYLRSLHNIFYDGPLPSRGYSK